jgi:hypothetical protein
VPQVSGSVRLLMNHPPPCKQRPWTALPPLLVILMALSSVTCSRLPGATVQIHVRSQNEPPPDCSFMVSLDPEGQSLGAGHLQLNTSYALGLSTSIFRQDCRAHIDCARSDTHWSSSPFSLHAHQFGGWEFVDLGAINYPSDFTAGRLRNNAD